MLRTAIDATALHGRRTGIGSFTLEILRRLAQTDDMATSAFAVTFRGRGQLASLLPEGVRCVGRPMAARPLRACWTRGDVPPIEWFIGAADVVHGPNFVVPPSRHAARLVTVHDLTPWRYPEMATADTRAYPALVARAVAGGAWVHTVSEFVADEVRSEYPAAAERVVVVPNGVTALPAESATTSAERGRALAGAERYVLALGTVEPRKDLPGLVRAFDSIAVGDDSVRLVLAGQDGWGADALATALDSASNRSRIVRLGWVSDDDRAALLRGATVFAYPSIYEGFGLPPLEAMLAGTAVLTTSAGSLPEVVGAAAAIVAPGDEDALAAALGSLLADDVRRAALVAAGYDRARRYSWDRCAADLADLYRRIAGKR